jgi:dihydroorotase
MRLMLTEVSRGRLTLSDYVRMACEAPARAFGLYPRKGALLPGADADLVVVDQARRDVIHKDRLHSIGRETPFDGVETVGIPVMTIVRGEIIAADGAIQTAPGWGQPVTHPLVSDDGARRARWLS